MEWPGHAMFVICLVGSRELQINLLSTSQREHHVVAVLVKICKNLTQVPSTCFVSEATNKRLTSLDSTQSDNPARNMDSDSTGL